MTSERAFIRQLAQRFPKRPPVEVGIGDDGAVLDCRGETRQIIVADMLLDGVHFNLQTTSPRLAGRKAVAVNLSDLAAMACRPTAAFISLALPTSLDSADAFLTELYDGVTELAERYGFSVAGGDTNTWDGPFAINVCLTGVPMRDKPILRSGAKPGDHLLVTGPLGGSLNGGRHLTLDPRLEFAEWLAAHADIHAMMDISDGLAIDLHRMMEASGTGALLEATGIPIHDDVPSNLSVSQRLQHALGDGEDFELLLAAPPSELSNLTRLTARVPLHTIGSVTAGNEVRIVNPDGAAVPLDESGWQHL